MKATSCLILAFTLCAAPALAADPWADAVVSYVPGDNLPSVFGSDPPIYFDNDQAALGEPSRTSDGFVVSPWSSPFTPNDIVSVGEGGSLTVSFDEPVTDDPGNPYGVDLLVFGNAFFLLNGSWPYPDDATTSGLTAEGGVIEISADGVNFQTVTGLDADGMFPTNGFADSSEFFPAVEGGVLSDFTLPVDPSFDPIGKTATETYDAYGASGGGAGVDIGAYGLSEISYVRVTNPLGSGVTPEIDGFADVRAVPEPTTLVLAITATLLSTRRRG